MNAAWIIEIDKIKHENRLLQIRNIENEERITPSNSIQNIVNKIDVSKIDLKSLLRIMTTYSGDKKENFEGWLLNTQLLLNKYELNEDDKITALLLVVKGVAREILQGLGPISDVKTIYAMLTKTYGRDRSTLMAQARQQTDESVTVYFGKLKATLSLIGILWNSSDTEPFFMESFINGLIPEIGERAKTLFLHNLDHAVSQAVKIEIANQLVREQRKNNNKQVTFGSTEST